MLSRFFVPIVALMLIVGGGNMAYTGLANRKLVMVEMASIVEAKPKAKWLKISGGEFDLINTSYSSTFGVGGASSVHIPLVLPGVDSTEETIHVLVETRDTILVNLVNQMREMEKANVSEEDLLKFMLENRDKLRMSRPVQGMVKSEIAKGKEEREIEEMYSNLSPDVIVIKEGERPDPLIGILIVVAGIIVVVLMVKFRGKPDSAQSSGTPPPLPTA